MGCVGLRRDKKLRKQESIDQKRTGRINEDDYRKPHSLDPHPLLFRQEKRIELHAAMAKAEKPRWPKHLMFFFSRRGQ